MNTNPNYRIYPKNISGTVTAPSSKSAAHRALICACLSKGVSIIDNIGSNDDILASIDIAKSLGADCVLEDERLVVTGTQSAPKAADCYCIESGSTLRFFTPIAAALGVDASFYGVGRLPERPMKELLNALKENGVSIYKEDNKMFRVSGQLSPGVYKIPGNITSQYISGLLFALPILKGDSEIIITTKTESKRYIDMTIQMMEKFGVKVISTDNGYLVPGNQEYKARNIIIEGDYSGAAFWLSAAAIGFDISVGGLDQNSLQADKGILDALASFGADIKHLPNGLIKVTSNSLVAADIDASEIPDSVPVLAVVAAYAKGKTRIFNAERLRIKESDRLKSMTIGLKALGVDISETEDGLIINGGKKLTGGITDSYADHRIAMSMSIAALGASEPVEIIGVKCVEKSYPKFYSDLKSLGGVYDVVSVGK